MAVTATQFWCVFVQVIMTLRVCQCTDNITYQYMLGFMENRQGDVDLKVYIYNVGHTNASVYLETYTELLHELIIGPGKSQTVPVPKDLEAKGSTNSTKGIRVTSNQNIIVYGINNIKTYYNSSDGFLSIPTGALGTQYYVVCLTSKKCGLLVVGVFCNTTVTMKLQTTNNCTYRDHDYQHGSVLTEEINEFDTIQIQCRNADLTGTEIRASKPIAVYSGNKFTPINFQWSHLVEQMPPLNSWGKLYVTTSSTKYRIRVVSGFTDTIVTYTCTNDSPQESLLQEIGSHLTHSFGINSSCLLSSDKPVLVVLLTKYRYEDSSMIVLNPIEKLTEEVIFNVPNNVSSSILNIVTNDSKSTYFLDGETLDLQFTEVEDSWFIAHVDNITGGFHSLGTFGVPILISGYIHGFNDRRAFGYPIAVQVNSSYEQGNWTLCETISTDPKIYTENTSSGIDVSNTCQCVHFVCSVDQSKEIRDVLERIRIENVIYKNSTKKYLRSLTSAVDNRTSSNVIGYSAGVVLVMIGLIIVAMDTHHLWLLVKRRK